MLKLTITVGGDEQDYTRYLDQASVGIDEGINVPATMTMVLKPVDWIFTVPPPRAYVKLYSTAFCRSLFTGFIVSAPERQYMSKAQLANTPELAGQLFFYTVTCASDDHLLNIKSVPFLPAFVNRTQGQILSDLAEVLCPGFFDTDLVLSGDIVPYFEYSPRQSWSELAKQFGDGVRYRYKVRDKKIWYQPIGDGPLGIDYDEAKPERSFKPRELKTDVITLPVVNDCTIIGDTEAGNNREDYFLGDGFTANFHLKHKVFRGSSTVLLQDDWQSPDLNTQQWFLQDPGSDFDFSAGALNVLTATTYTLGDSYLSMNNGLELAGGIELQHGEITFDDVSDGIIGGIYTDALFTEASLLAGFNITSPGTVETSASGAAGILIQPWFMGAAVGDDSNWVTTKENHNYVLQTLVHAPVYTRYTRVYRTSSGEEFGGIKSDSLGSITFIIQDYDIAAATGFYYQPEVKKITVENVSLPPFATYAVVNNRKLNITLGNTVAALMPLGGLVALEGPSGLYTPTGLILPMLPFLSGSIASGSTRYIGPVLPWPSEASGLILPPPLPLGATGVVEQLGAGNKIFNLQAAQISPGNSSDTLAFYAQSIPAAGTPVRLQTWEAQAAVSRIQDRSSISFEKFVVGDDGIRATIISDFNPLPRTSEDCDSAAMAFLKDRVGTFYRGGYQVESLQPYFLNASGYAVSGMAASGSADLQFWPTPGRFLPVRAPRRGIGTLKPEWQGAMSTVPASGFYPEQMLVTRVSFKLLDMRADIVMMQVQFGADLQLEKVLRNFVDLTPPKVLTPVDKANPPNPRSTTLVGTSGDFIPDLNDASINMREIKAEFITVNVNGLRDGQAIEVRSQDINWGQVRKNGRPTADYINTVHAPTFTLDRQQYDQVWYMRPITVVPPSIHPPRPRRVLTSRRSKVIRLQYPLRPLHPLLTDCVPIQALGPTGFVNTFQLQFQYNGDVRNIYGFELRAKDNTTVLVQRPAVSTLVDLFVDLSRTPFLWQPSLSGDAAPELFPYFFNAQWDYSFPHSIIASGIPPDRQFTIVEKATFGIGVGQPQAIGDDVAQHYMVRKPGFLVDCVGNAKKAPTLAPLYISISRSTNEGGDWHPIFIGGDSSGDGVLVIPANDTTQHIQNQFMPDQAVVQKGDWLKISLLGSSGEDAEDIEVVLRWGAPTGVQ